MKKSISTITPAYDTINHLMPYKAGKPMSEVARELGFSEAEIIKLASNENPLGCSAQVIKSVQQTLKNCHRYPDANGYELKQALLQFFKSRPQTADVTLGLEHITLGNGSNDILDMITRTFVNHQDTVIYSQYGFIVYKLAIKAVGANAIEVPATSGFAHDLDAILTSIQPNTKLIFLANPNNPTGTYFDHQALLDFLAKVPKGIIVVLDEAYVEYFEPDEYTSSITLLASFKNLIIVRTFSKAYGLAGFRVGYALSHPDLADYINRIRQPFNVGLLAQQAAISALSDQDFIQQVRQTNNTQKQLLQTTLEQMNISYIASKTNFLMLKASDVLAKINVSDQNSASDKQQSGQVLYQLLLEKGIITRAIGVYGLGDWLRVSIGLPQENSQLIQILNEWLNF